jgi:PQQ-dependent catabolism-associated CXXCW motif protein
MIRLAVLSVLCLWGTFTLASEDEDFGVVPVATLRLSEFSAPTPREVPGARTVRTAELRRLLDGDAAARPLLFDVLGGEAHDSLPGAIWLPGAGRGTSFEDALQAQLARALEAATRGNRSHPVAFFCQGPRCWLSYNAALRAVALGYREVLWYRGGIEAWRAAGGRLAPLRVAWRRPEG